MAIHFHRASNNGTADAVHGFPCDSTKYGFSWLEKQAYVAAFAAVRMNNSVNNHDSGLRTENSDKI